MITFQTFVILTNSSKPKGNKTINIKIIFTKLKKGRILGLRILEPSLMVIFFKMTKVWNASATCIPKNIQKEVLLCDEVCFLPPGLASQKANFCRKMSLKHFFRILWNKSCMWYLMCHRIFKIHVYLPVCSLILKLIRTVYKFLSHIFFYIYFV